MKGTGLATLGITINGFITLVCMTSGQYPDGLGMLMLAFVALSIVGLVLIGSGKPIAGARCVIGGSLFFVPIGLIGAIGGFKILDQAKEQEFQARMEQVQ